MNLRPHLWLGSFRPSLEARHRLNEQEARWCAGLAVPLQGRYCASRSLVRQTLGRWFQCAPEAVPLHSPPGCPPQLGESWGAISFSHSGGQLLIGWSPWAIGVDLEPWGRPLRAASLGERYFPSQERQGLAGLDPEPLRRAVLESWVCKEAAIKWQRTSIASDLQQWCWDRHNRRLLHLELGHSPPVRVEVNSGWACAAVGEGVDRAQWS